MADNCGMLNTQRAHWLQKATHISAVLLLTAYLGFTGPSHETATTEQRP